MVHTLRLDNYSTTPRKLVLGTNSSFGTESIKIERGAGWDGLNLTATWHIPGREEPLRVALLDGDAMDVPPEVTKEAKDGVLVLAGLASGVQRASCNVEYLILEQAGVYGGADAEPTPELAAQVLEATMRTKANAEAAAQDASEAKANANMAQQAAENAAADAAKAGPYTEAALNAKKAAEAAQDTAIAAGLCAENAANAAAGAMTAAAESASKAAASEKAAAAIAIAAAGSATQAEAQKTAAAKAASDAQGYMQAASSAATAANASAENAAGSKAAAASSATAAEESKQAAVTSEVKAAESEQAAKASEQAAAKSAQAALESKTAAETSEGNAAASAKKAQDVSDSLPADYTAMSGDVDTLKNQMQRAYPDDSTIGENPWSSKHIVDMLCPEIKESGNPVLCYPVAGYPLGVKASWEPVQEGSGDPSPENIRPIKGRDSVTITRQEDNQVITLTLPETVYGGEVDAVTGDGKETWKTLTLDGTEAWAQGDHGSGTSAFWTMINNKLFDGTYGPHSFMSHFKNVGDRYPFVPGAMVPYTYCDHPNLPRIYLDYGTEDATIDDLKAWLAAQKATGTPVQICYKLAEPVPFTATGAQPLPALVGVNTVLTDADSTTVTGRADPIKRIEDLEAAVASIN